MAVAEVLAYDTQSSALSELPKNSEVSKADSQKWELGRKDVLVTSELPKRSADLNSSAAFSGAPTSVHLVKQKIVSRSRAAVWEKVIQTWEGRVVCNLPDEREFVAIISDLTCRGNPNEEVVIGYDSVIPSDISLIAEGAVFFWNVGRYRTISKQRMNPSRNHFEIRFRRLPPISEGKLFEIKVEAQRLINKLYAD